ncbi:hypothetical protein [Haloglomus halophilum]|uniref:hypothetical protein n=1 Tax=Haloglomus halophilum TaxID=2962672 RepID=UPI0020C98837|nr:hypothetical protein [Haloglomus halophilum]
MTRSRRSLLTALAGSATLLGGCGASERESTPTRDSGTPTVTFTTSTPTVEDTASPTESPTDEPTETQDPVAEALAAARGDIETSIARLESAAVVADGRVGLVTEDAFAEYAAAKDPWPPVREARERLEFVSDRAAGDRGRSVNGLLFLCEYLETRAVEHDRIVDGFSSFYQANRSFPGELELDGASAAIADMQALQERTRTAGEILDRVEPRADALGVEGFDLRSARKRQRVFQSIGREFEPAFAGTRSMLRAYGLTSATAPAIERGEYAQAEEFATNAVTAAENGRRFTATAFERDVRHFRDVFEQDRCLCDGLQTAGERYQSAARAYREGQAETGRERYRAAKNALEATEEECGIEL